jgi:NTE family protein
MDLFRLLRRPAASTSTHAPGQESEPTPNSGPETDLATAPETDARRLSLGLQGGGAHGAFEWGVLDRLLEDDRIVICAVTAASAGAMNAVALAAGLAEGGPDGARAKLDRFWRGVNQAGGRNVFGDSALWTAAMNPSWLRANPFYRRVEPLMLAASPYEFNPFNLNPLHDVLEKTVDFELVRSAPLEVFVSATDVRDSKLKVFVRPELTPEMVMASAALPNLFQAVEIDGRRYWDGGYLGNPALWPLIEGDGEPSDILLVTLNPFHRNQTPRTAGEIVDRLNEITMNASLSAELRAIAFVQRLIEEGQLTDEAKAQYRQIRIHAIDADHMLQDLSLSSKFNIEWTFLTGLKERGRQAADAWLAAHFDDLGVRSSFDVQGRFG